MFCFTNLYIQKRYQEAIEDITKRMGAGMAKFICKEVCDTQNLCDVDFIFFSFEVKHQNF